MYVNPLGGGTVEATFLNRKVRLLPATCTLAKVLFCVNAGFTFRLRMNLVILAIAESYLNTVASRVAPESKFTTEADVFAIIT